MVNRSFYHAVKLRQKYHTQSNLFSRQKMRFDKCPQTSHGRLANSSRYAASSPHTVWYYHVAYNCDDKLAKSVIHNMESETSKKRIKCQKQLGFAKISRLKDYSKQ